MADIQAVGNKGRFPLDAEAPNITEMATRGWYDGDEGSGGDTNPADTTTSVAIIIGLFSLICGWGPRKKE